MKKIIKFVSLFTLNILIINNTIGCTFSDNSSDIPIPPVPPHTKTIDDYNKDIKLNVIKIRDVKGDLSNSDKIPDKDWRMYARHMYKGALGQYRAQIKDDRYQILLLEYANNLSKNAKKKAKKILNDELTALKKEIKFLSDKSLHGDAKKQVISAENQQNLVNQEIKNLQYKE